MAVTGVCGRGGGGQARVAIAGYLRRGDGLGSHAEQIEEHLARTRPVRIHVVEGGAAEDEAGNESAAVVAAPAEAAVGGAGDAGLAGGVTLVVVEPYRLRAARGPTEYRVYLTLFESDRIPASWAERLNADASEAHAPRPRQ